MSEIASVFSTGRPIASAIDRYKTLLANALERVCVLEEQLEIAQHQLAECRQQSENGQVQEPEDA